MGRITIKDIARLLEINPSTVSRALKNHPDISQETKDIVQRVAQELGYLPNYQAIHFRNRSSGLIGLILPNLKSHFFPSVVRAIEEVTRKNRFNLGIFQSDESHHREMESVQICKSFGVEGLLVSFSTGTKDINHLKEFVEDKIPVVLFDRVIESSFFSTVSIHDMEASYKAVLHLAQKGYKHIAGIFDSQNLTTTKNRIVGFQKALQASQLVYDERRCLIMEKPEEAWWPFMQIVQSEIPIDAIFVMSDILLENVMRGVYELGIKVPEQLAIICISDGHLPYFCNPKISHIHHSGYEVGENAANLLFDIITKKKRGDIINYKISTRLVELAST